jgi:ubiquinone/menaquinone biosynthesis C-methylase UbiE
VTFEVAGSRYDNFMGRFTAPLAPLLADAAGVREGEGLSVVDVGCGPGGLTAELAARVGDERVAAIDPSPPFVEACRARVPGADVRVGGAEALPWPDDAFDACLSSLVLGFLQDPLQGMREMARVTRSGGRVAVCYWDIPRQELLMLGHGAVAEARRDVAPVFTAVGSEQGQIAAIMREVGLSVEQDGELTVEASYAGFDDLWDSIVGGAGPLIDSLQSMSDDEVETAREVVRSKVPDGPFTLSAVAWYAVGRV